MTEHQMTFTAYGISSPLLYSPHLNFCVTHYTGHLILVPKV